MRNADALVLPAGGLAMSKFNYVCSAQKPTVVTHSLTGNFTSSTDRNLILGCETCEPAVVARRELVIFSLIRCSAQQMLATGDPPDDRRRPGAHARCSTLRPHWHNAAVQTEGPEFLSTLSLTLGRCRATLKTACSSAPSGKLASSWPNDDRHWAAP
jgi:hypothetical protein